MNCELISKLSIDVQKILKQELKCYLRLIELSERQRYFIHLGDIYALMSILSQKEVLIGKISHLENSIQNIFRPFPELREQMPESVNRLINTIIAVLERLHVLEKESEAKFIEKYNEMKKELLNLKQTKTILKTYVPKKVYRPRFIDKKT